MLYLNMLQLSFWLGLLYSFFALPGTRGAIFVNSSLNANQRDGLDGPPDVTVCVNDAQYPTWRGSAPDRFDIKACQDAVNLVISLVEGKLYLSYDFYSRQVYPSGLAASGFEAWPLAQGASSSKSKTVPAGLSNDRRLPLKTYTGGCALVVRMTRDFANDALPLSSSRFAHTSRAKATQTDSWLIIMRAVENLLSVCVRGEGLPGWSMDTKNIVVAFWPRFSPVDVKYGIRAESSQPEMDTSRTIVIF